MGIKEVNPLVKNLFQTGLKAFFPFRRGGRFIFFSRKACLSADRTQRREGVSKAVLCGFARKTLLLPLAKNPPNPLYKGELHPWDSQPLIKK